jgi:NAD(P)H-flavin reductase/ferredoxin
MTDGMCRVRLEPSAVSFAAGADETVLNAALRQGISLRYGCRHGNCSTCKYLLLEGDVDFGNASPYSLPEREREEGWALLCCARPLTDLVIQVADEPEEGLRPVISPGERYVRVEKLEQVSRALWRLRLALEEPLDFYPGQFLELELPDRAGEWRSYSMGSSPARRETIDLVIGRIPGGAFSDRIERYQPGFELHVRGPYGTSYLREGDRAVLLVGGGSGLAPMISILEYAADTGDPRPFTFYYGARTRADLPLVEQIQAFNSRLPKLAFLPALSEPTQDCNWDGPVGLIAQEIQRSLADASPYDAYLCGPPPMCDTVALILAAKGLAEQRCHLDPFYSAIHAKSDFMERVFG